MIYKYNERTMSFEPISNRIWLKRGAFAILVIAFTLGAFMLGLAWLVSKYDLTYKSIT